MQETKDILKSKGYNCIGYESDMYCYAKYVKHENEYVDDNGEHMFTNVLKIALFVYINGQGEFIDGYGKVMESTRIKTREDNEAIYRTLDSFQEEMEEIFESEQDA